MKLAELMTGVPMETAPAAELARNEVKGLAYDSRKVKPGFAFFAFPGAKADGRSYAQQALKNGAVAVVAESEKPAEFDGAWIRVAHGRRALAVAARRFYGNPDQKLRLTGVTGTNGKTTTVNMVDAMLRHAGAVTGVVGTIEYRIGDEVRPAVNTTPESLDLAEAFAEVVKIGGTHFTMEVSSHALALGRVYGFEFHTAAFTNLTRDHLDYHQTMEAYFDAKQMLFDGAGARAPKYAVLNADDGYTRKIRVAEGTQALTYGIDAACDLQAVGIQSGFQGLRFEVKHAQGRQRVESPMVGRINVYNLLAAFGVGMSYGLETEAIAAGLATCHAVPGRFERVDEGQPFLVVVDYAHTDDALKNTIAVARALNPKRIITLFGCGGDRDRAKRPLMGQAAGEASDFVVVTSDNPRSEDPLDIINDAMVGVGRTDVRNVVEPDREKAIRRAMEEAAPGDIVLLAGKGHETYQILKSGPIDFDDREVARRILRGFGYRKEEPK
jgi:UDP-N-acetylmuramoyl-L-alanyl-D-glutamate--2,6-diaminopimelate ligase